METSASFEAWSAPSPYPAILGRAMDTSASCEARYAPLLYPISFRIVPTWEAYQDLQLISVQSAKCSALVGINCRPK